MNAFQRRLADARNKRDARNAMRRDEEFMRARVKQHNLITQFERAFQELHRQTPKVIYKNGWYCYNNTTLREQAFVLYTQMMQASLHERDILAEGEA